MPPLGRPLEQLLRFYELLDAGICFMLRRRVPPTLNGVRSLVESLGGAGTFQDARLRAVQTLCPKLIRRTKLATARDAVGRGDGDVSEECEVLDFASHRGWAKAKIAARRALVRKAALVFVQDAHARWREANGGEGEGTDDAGWAPGFPVDDLTLPGDGAAGNSETNRAWEADSTEDAAPSGAAEATEGGWPEPVTPLEAAARLRSLPWHSGQCVHVERIPARTARLVPLSEVEMHNAVRAMLVAAGRDALFTHQAGAIRAALAGSHVVLSTPTSSGKSLAYIAPMCDAIVRDTSAVAMLLFPTKVRPPSALQCAAFAPLPPPP